MFGNPLIPESYPRGTLCAAIGLIGIGAYYVRAWRHLRTKANPPLTPGPSDPFVSLPRPPLHSLQMGMWSSVLFFLFAGAADSGNNWLDRTVGCLMGLVGALAVGIFGVGFVALANLWREIALQLKKAKTGSLLLSVPLAMLYLALGLGAFVLLGGFLEKIPSIWHPLLRSPLWFLIAWMFYALWKGRSHAALTLRLILLVLFSAVIVSALGFSFWYLSSQTSPLLVILLSATGAINVIFYARWARPAALKDSLA